MWDCEMFILSYVNYSPMRYAPSTEDNVSSIFAVTNPKGGSGKTTVAIILAGESPSTGTRLPSWTPTPKGRHTNGTHRLSRAA